MEPKIFNKIALSFLVMSPFAMSAKVDLPDIMSSNAVLQQQSDAKLWGWASPGKTVSVVT